jgi:acyl-coenzyme A thioesterase PaaI-like protein
MESPFVLMSVAGVASARGLARVSPGKFVNTLCTLVCMTREPIRSERLAPTVTAAFEDPQGHSIASLLGEGDEERLVGADFLRLPGECSLSRLGIELQGVSRRSARSLTEVRDIHLNQRGQVQGGIYGVIADATAGWAAEAFLGGPSYVTTNFTGQLVGVATRGDQVRADAVVVHGGRRTVAVAVELRRLRPDSEPRLIATFSCQQLVVDS